MSGARSIVGGLVPAAGRVLRLGEALSKGIEPSRFGRFAPGAAGPIASNHPAFVYGHLALYPEAMAAMLDVELDVSPPAAWSTLFAPGARCVDDPDGTVYPAADVLLGAFLDWHGKVLSAAEGVSDATLLRPTPIERYREAFPTSLTAVSFLLLGHTMMHLGQLSAWRRAEGLGSAM